MNKLNSLVAAVVALLLGACAHMANTEGWCMGSSVCPIVIYEKFPNVFATYPESMHIASDQPDNIPTLIWTFADQSKYEFLSQTNSPSGDGVQLIGASGARIGLAPCFITRDSGKDVTFAVRGPYLRCDVRNSADFKETRYRVIFHGRHDGLERMVDPTVDSSGSGDVGFRRPANTPKTAEPRPPFPMTVNLPDGAHIPVLDGYESIDVTFDPGANGSFEQSDAAYLYFTDDKGNDVNLQPCFISKYANGSSRDASGRYFFCRLTTTLNTFAYRYSAKYRVGGSVKQVDNVDFIRP